VLQPSAIDKTGIPLEKNEKPGIIKGLANGTIKLLRKAGQSDGWEISGVQESPILS
jgi:hypothetical protein